MTPNVSHRPGPSTSIMPSALMPATAAVGVSAACRLASREAAPRSRAVSENIAASSAGPTLSSNQHLTHDRFAVAAVSRRSTGDHGHLAWFEVDRGARPFDRRNRRALGDEIHQRQGEGRDADSDRGVESQLQAVGELGGAQLEVLQLRILHTHGGR